MIARPALRLVAVAAAAWGSAAAGVLGSAAGFAGLLAAAAAGLVVVGLAPALVGRSVLAVLVVAGCAAGAAVLRTAPLVSGPLPSAAADGAYVTATLVLTGDPVAQQGRTSGSYRSADRVVATADLVQWRRAGAGYASALPVRVAWHDTLLRPAPGTLLTVRGRIGPDDPLRRSAAYLAAESVTVTAPAPDLQEGAQRLRAALQAAASGVGGDGAALLPGLVVGDTSAVGDDLDQAMKDSGLAHLTAVSGGNVAVTLGMIWWVARAAGLRRRGLVALGAVMLPAYVVLVRPEPSVARAALMAAVGMLALLGGRRTDGAAVLAVTVTGLVVLDPFLTLRVGFALSVAATAGLVTLGRRLAPRRAGGVVRALGQSWAAAVAASLAAAPLVAAIGGGVPLLSVPANVLAEPAVGPASVLGLLVAGLGVLAPGPAAVLAHVATVPAGWIAAVARHAQDVPGAVLPWPTGAPGGGLLAVVLLLVLAAGWAAHRAGRLRPVAAAGAVVLLVVVVLPAAGRPLLPSSWPPEGWVIVACDVGQGDGLVLNAGPGIAVVVDAGPDPAAMDRCLQRLGVRRVPALLLTHEHADHVEGVPGVLRGGREVGEVIVSPLADPPGEASRVRGWAAAAGVPVRAAAAGEQVRVGALEWTVLWPQRLLTGTDSGPNNASLVLLVRAGGLTLLLAGDVEPPAQGVLLGEQRIPHVDVVKVPHHGSRHQDPRYAVTSAPGVALVSCGRDNDYGHPAAATLQAYQAVGAAIGRTDTEGDLAVVADPLHGGPLLLARGR